MENREKQFIEREKAYITITLNSDLCVASGYGYAGIIDSDICADENGFPYIPARRLKGVMRQAAEMFGNAIMVKRLFGEGGAAKNHGIVLGDAVLAKRVHSKDGSEQIVDLTDLGRKIAEIRKKDEKTCLKQQNIIKLFSSVRVQTELDDNGVANENTLRYIRVVDQFLPRCLDQDQKRVCFRAPIEYASEDRDILKKIVCAVRHIGMERNRGFGNVRCELSFMQNIELLTLEPHRSLEPDGSLEEKVVIDYAVRNVDQLMLSGAQDDVSEQYISGRVVLGTLAGIYLRRKGLSEPDEIFDDLFLNGKSIFSNLYVTDTVQKKYPPAPMLINRLKKTQKYVCVAQSFKKGDGADYDPSDGNQPKKLSGKFLNMDNGIKVIEPKKDILYHHSKAKVYEKARMKKGEGNGILYSMEVLEKNQLFSGTVTVERGYEGVIRSLLGSSDLRFGKSKSAQYGSCELAYISEKSRLQSEEGKKWNADRLYVVFESDAVIPGKYGYTVQSEEVRSYVADALGLKSPENAGIWMSTKTVTGYHSKMNLKRASVPAISAGSVFEMEAGGAEVSEIHYLGCFLSEGFGRVRLIRKEALSYVLEEEKGVTGKASEDATDKASENVKGKASEDATDKASEEATGKTSEDCGVKMSVETPGKNSEDGAGRASEDTTGNAMKDTVVKLSVDDISSLIRSMRKEIERQIQFDGMKVEFLKNADSVGVPNISASLVGRVTLMLQESRYAENPAKDFAERVLSIKRDKEREQVITYLKKWGIMDIQVARDGNDWLKLKKAEILMKQDDEQDTLWQDYLSFILLHVKYQMSASRKAIQTQQRGEHKDV